MKTGQRDQAEVFHKLICAGRVCIRVLLWSEAHAEAGQIAVGEGEEDYEDDVPGVVIKQNGEVVTRRDVAEHEEWDEDDPQAHQHRKPDAVFTRLDRE